VTCEAGALITKSLLLLSAAFRHVEQVLLAHTGLVVYTLYIYIQYTYSRG